MGWVSGDCHQRHRQHASASRTRGLPAGACKPRRCLPLIRRILRRSDTRTWLTTSTSGFGGHWPECTQTYSRQWLPRRLDELIADPHRHGDSMGSATKYFVEGFTETFHDLSAATRPGLPMLIIYAHRQEESDGDGVASSTAWDAMLSAIIAAGLRIVGTWPLHATSSSRQRGLDSNAVASYIVLVCRPQEAGAKPTDRQGFVAALHAELPRSIRKLQDGDISTVDLAS